MYANFSHQTLSLIEVLVHLNNSQIESDLHPKLSDKHQYLFKTSCQPILLTQNVPYHLTCLTCKFYIPATPLTISTINTAMNWLTFQTFKDTVFPFQKRKSTAQVPSHAKKNPPNSRDFVVTYNPVFLNFPTGVQTNRNILRSSKNRCKQILLSPPIREPYKRSPNLRPLLFV